MDHQERFGFQAGDPDLEKCPVKSYADPDFNANDPNNNYSSVKKLSQETEEPFCDYCAVHKKYATKKSASGTDTSSPVASPRPKGVYYYNKVLRPPYDHHVIESRDYFNHFSNSTFMGLALCGVIFCIVFAVLIVALCI